MRTVYSQTKDMRKRQNNYLLHHDASQYQVARASSATEVSLAENKGQNFQKLVPSLTLQLQYTESLTLPKKN
jgi:hypothetical protein